MLLGLRKLLEPEPMTLSEVRAGVSASSLSLGEQVFLLLSSPGLEWLAHSSTETDPMSLGPNSEFLRKNLSDLAWVGCPLVA